MYRRVKLNPLKVMKLKYSYLGLELAWMQNNICVYVEVNHSFFKRIKG